MPALEDIGIALTPRGQSWRYELDSIDYRFNIAEGFIEVIKALPKEAYVFAIWVTPVGKVKLAPENSTRFASVTIIDRTTKLKKH
jgi:hypothetical protein